MDLLLLLKACVLGVVEGITEFLPISSTAHLLFVQDWIQFHHGHLSALFEIVIQLGAILAVIWLYRVRLWRMGVGLIKRDPAQSRFVMNLVVAVIPAGVLGVLFMKTIDALLGNHFALYAMTLILGGCVMLWVEKKPHMAKELENQSFQGQITRVEDITTRQALVIGLAQCVAMIPGVSRSGSTIVAAMLMGIHRKTATEFTFFLAIPTMIGATLLSLLKKGMVLDSQEWILIGVGFWVAFLSALIVIKALLHYLSKYSYQLFGWYRIVFGILIMGVFFL